MLNRMDAFIRTLVQYALFPFFVISGGEIECKPDTLKCKFLNWLYGDPERVSDGWIYPDKK